jgi:type I restriction enzyme S subunit
MKHENVRLTAQQLRSSILQLAVQGKLVPQDPHDEPASVLLKKIRKEKQTLAKAGKIKKEKPLKAITDEEIPFVVPAGWEWVRLGDVINLTSGQDMSPDKYNIKNRGVPYITGASNIENGKIIINRWTLTPKAISKKGDLLLTCKGTVGVLAFLDNEKAHIARPMMAIQINRYLCSGFVKIYMEFQVASLKNAAKSMIPGISRNDVLDMLFPLPPLAEQKRIVTKIEALLPLVDVYDKAEQKLTALNAAFPDLLKKAVLKDAVQGKLVPQDPHDEPTSVLLQKIRKEKLTLVKAGKIKKEKPLKAITDEKIPFVVPAGWEWVRLENLAWLIGDGLHGTPMFDNLGDYYFINGNNLKIYFYDSTKHINKIEYNRYRTELNEQSVLLSINGTIGNIAFYDNEKIILGKSVAYINLLKNIDKEYISIFLKSKIAWNYFKEKHTGTTIKNLGLAALRDCPIPLPPLAEQKRIVAKIEALMPLVDVYDKAEQKLTALNAAFPDLLKKAVLQDAVQGKLVPQDPHDEPASVLLQKIRKEKRTLVKAGKIKKEKPVKPVTNAEIPFDIPAGWEWVRLGEAVHDLGQKKPDQQFSYIDVGSIDNFNGKLSDDENILQPENAPSRARKIIEQGVVIYSTVRPYLLNICIIDREPLKTHFLILVSGLLLFSTSPTQKTL